jgi:hypothetical protein
VKKEIDSERIRREKDMREGGMRVIRERREMSISDIRERDKIKRDTLRDIS